MEQLRIMQERTRAAKLALEEEERKAEELQRLALKKRAPPIPARLPDKPPLPAQPPAPPKVIYTLFSFFPRQQTNKHTPHT